jgi:serine/threonine-protein kinase
MSPRNLMLAEGERTIKLIDFGLSIPAQEPFFQPGNRTGNPNYMAPELVHRRATDHRVDVFAFGVTAYEVITSHLPWPEGRTGQIAMSHDQRPFAVQRWRPQINPRLAQAIHHCIEPIVKRRCPSISVFLEAIRDVDHEDSPDAG